MPILWGVELLVLAVEAGGLPAAKAAEIGKAICAENPRMGAEVLAAFLEKVGE